MTDAASPIDPQQNAENTPEISGQKIDSDRPPCHVNFYMNADSFSAQMLQQIPELQAVVTIPIWDVTIANVPNGRIRLRNEQPPYAEPLLRVMQKLAEFGVDVHRDTVGQLSALANVAENIVKEIQQKTAELNSLQEKIEVAKAGAPTQNTAKT